jgi:hypothetical protein
MLLVDIHPVHDKDCQHITLLSNRPPYTPLGHVRMISVLSIIPVSTKGYLFLFYPLLVCEGCCELIFSRFVMKVGNTSWHEECLFCSECHASLNNSCFYKDGRLFCRTDYERFVLEIMA